MLAEEVIETLRAWALVEDQRRSEHVLRVALRLEDPLVRNAAQDLVLAAVGALDRLALLGRGAGGDAIDADAGPLVVERHVLRRPVLIGRALEEQLLEHPVAHLPRTLRGADPRLLHRAGNR